MATSMKVEVWRLGWRSWGRSCWGGWFFLLQSVEGWWSFFFPRLMLLFVFFLKKYLILTTYILFKCSIGLPEKYRGFYQNGGSSVRIWYHPREDFWYCSSWRKSPIFEREATSMAEKKNTKKYTSKKSSDLLHIQKKRYMVWCDLDHIIRSFSFVSQDDLDELEESAWHVASVLPAIPNFVHPSLEVVLFPNGQRGVVVTASWHKKVSGQICQVQMLEDSFCLWSPQNCYLDVGSWLLEVFGINLIFGSCFFSEFSKPPIPHLLQTFFQFKSGNLVTSQIFPRTDWSCWEILKEILKVL